MRHCDRRSVLQRYHQSTWLCLHLAIRKQDLNMISPGNLVRCQSCTSKAAENVSGQLKPNVLSIQPGILLAARICQPPGRTTEPITEWTAFKSCQDGDRSQSLSTPLTLSLCMLGMSGIGGPRHTSDGAIDASALHIRHAAV